MEKRIEDVISATEENQNSFIEDLKSLSRIPSISFPGYPAEELSRCADAVAANMKESGLENVEILEMDGAPPYVYGEWTHAENAPTLLLYAHYDVQPVGREDKWKSPPFEPTIHEDGRLYARGIVDDKAGYMVHAAAIRSYLQTWKSLPLNIKFVAEGEEEVGSSHIDAFLAKYKEKIQADFIALTDTGNLDTGHPAITYALRGITVLDLEVSGLKGPLHSGTWGGPVPDPLVALCKIIARLVNEDGSINVEGLYDDVREATDKEKAALEELPFDESLFRGQAGMSGDQSFSGEKGRNVWEKMWTRPSLSVHALEASSMKGAINQVLDTARARLSIRTVPNQNPEKILELFAKALTKDVPWGLTAKVSNGEAAPWWMTEPDGPAFEAAARAMEKGYNKKPAMIGCGGSIPFVGTFSEALGGVPALLVGIEDPYCNAHAENESLDLEDFRKSIRSAVYLYDELSRI